MRITFEKVISFFLLILVGVAIYTPLQQTTDASLSYSIEHDTILELEDGSFSDTRIVSDTVELEDNSTTGWYYQTIHASTEVEFTEFRVVADVPNSTGLNVTLESNTEDYDFEVSDGENSFDVSVFDAYPTVNFTFRRNSTSTDSPALDSYELRGHFINTEATLISLIKTLFVIGLVVAAARYLN